ARRAEDGDATLEEVQRAQPAEEVAEDAEEERELLAPQQRAEEEAPLLVRARALAPLVALFGRLLGGGLALGRHLHRLARPLRLVGHGRDATVSDASKERGRARAARAAGVAGGRRDARRGAAAERPLPAEPRAPPPPPPHARRPAP